MPIIKKELTPEQRVKVDELARKLIAEEKSLREIRKAPECSQAELAKRLGMNQGDLSKFERRTDVYLSTVRHYVEALGGLSNWLQHSLILVRSRLQTLEMH